MPVYNPDSTFIDPIFYMTHYYRVAQAVDSCRTICVNNDTETRNHLIFLSKSLSVLYQYEFKLMKSVSYKLIETHAVEHDHILDFTISAATSDEVCYDHINSIANNIGRMMSHHAENFDRVLNDYIKIKYYSSTINDRSP